MEVQGISVDFCKHVHAVEAQGTSGDLYKLELANEDLGHHKDSVSSIKFQKRRWADTVDEVEPPEEGLDKVMGTCGMCDGDAAEEQSVAPEQHGRHDGAGRASRGRKRRQRHKAAREEHGGHVIAGCGEPHVEACLKGIVEVQGASSGDVDGIEAFQAEAHDFARRAAAAEAAQSEQSVAAAVAAAAAEAARLISSFAERYFRA